MDLSFWNDLWDTGRIGFHQSAVNRFLARYVEHLTEPAAAGILVPLCGKSHDLTFLAERFDRVVGVEFIATAVRAYFDERGAAFTQRDVAGVERFEGAGVVILAADFHDVTQDHTGPIDRVFDRASMVALPPETRPRYAAHLLSLLPHGGRILLVTMAAPERPAEQGPPFSVPEQEIRALYGHTCEIEVLDRTHDADRTITVWSLTKH